MVLYREVIVFSPGPAKGIVERGCTCIPQQDTNVRLQLRDTENQGCDEPCNSTLIEDMSGTVFCTRLRESGASMALPYLCIVQRMGTDRVDETSHLVRLFTNLY